MNEINLDIRLELRTDGEAIEGSVSAAGERHEFSGWIGLVAVVDALVETARQEAAPPTI
jgi:hypothetical protein